jgi:hypothetical protein
MRQKSTEPLPGDRKNGEGFPQVPSTGGVPEGRGGFSPRLPDWEPRLNRWASELIGAPFVLGKTNCSMLAARAIDTMYGTDYTSEFLDVADTDETELAEAADRRTLREFEAHGFSRVPENFEQPGDILIGWKDPFERCAVYLGGDRVLTSSREKGICLVPLGVFRRAYNAEGFRWV